jgi:hypothetical protein
VFKKRPKCRPSSTSSFNIHTLITMRSLHYSLLAEHMTSKTCDVGGGGGNVFRFKYSVLRKVNTKFC